MHAGVAEGLSHMHSQGVLHNDVKADNVALSDCQNARKILQSSGLPSLTLAKHAHSMEERNILYSVTNEGSSRNATLNWHQTC